MTNAREEIMRLMREEYDPHPNWELPAGEWDDNAEDVADKIVAAALSEKPVHVSEAWRILKKWAAEYAWEEATFSRYRDDTLLDGVMTASDRRKLSALLASTTRPSAWARPIRQPSTPNGPAEYDVDMVWGDDRPSGEGWIPLFCEVRAG